MHATYFQETSHILSTLSDTFDSTCETPKIDFADFIDMLRVKVSAFARQLPNCIHVTFVYISDVSIIHCLRTIVYDGNTFTNTTR